MSETITFGLRIPTRISAGAPFEALSAGAAAPLPMLLAPMLLAPNDHCVTALVVLARASSTRNKPALRMSSEHAARMNVPASSSSDALSINQNDGKVKKTPTTAETAKARIRSPNRKLAELMMAELKRDVRPMRFMLRHANTTSVDSTQYTMAKNARETTNPRAANITSSLPS